MAARTFNENALRDGFGNFIRRPNQPRISYKPKHTTSTNPMKQRPTYQPVARQSTPVWPEYRHTHPTNYVYSDINHKARMAAMDALVKRCDNILNGAYRPKGH